MKHHSVVSILSALLSMAVGAGFLLSSTAIHSLQGVVPMIPFAPIVVTSGGEVRS